MSQTVERVGVLIIDEVLGCFRVLEGYEHGTFESARDTLFLLERFSHKHIVDFARLSSKLQDLIEGSVQRESLLNNSTSVHIHSQ